VSRLQQFATQYSDILGLIAGYVKRISYKMDYSTLIMRASVLHLTVVTKFRKI
jgi:hypothetical protein